MPPSPAGGRNLALPLPLNSPNSFPGCKKNARSRAKKRLREKHRVYFAKTFFNLAYLGRDATVGRSG